MCIKGEVIQVKQTGGPTIFTLADDSGLELSARPSSAPGSAPTLRSIATWWSAWLGKLNSRNNQVQIEIKSMKRLWGGDAAQVKAEIESAIDRRAEPTEVPFLVESDFLTKLKPAMMKVAKEIRRAIYKSKPIVLRHHADADGITAAVADNRPPSSPSSRRSGEPMPSTITTGALPPRLPSTSWRTSPRT